MSLINTGRRQASLLALCAVAASATLAVSGGSASAYQGNMERAQAALYSALASLREASSNKGGHRVKAMQLIQQAIDEVGQGIEFADENGGGGAQ